MTLQQALKVNDLPFVVHCERLGGLVTVIAKSVYKSVSGKDVYVVEWDDSANRQPVRIYLDDEVTIYKEPCEHEPPTFTINGSEENFRPYCKHCNARIRAEKWVEVK